MAPTDPPDVIAAGVVVIRKGGEVLLVHRPKYDDWSFPKGKLDPGEHVTTAAVREVAEETGLDVRLGPPLPPQHYRVGDGEQRPKRVYYWVGHVLGDDDVSEYRVNDEVDEVAWVPLDEAARRLTYSRDRGLLDSARPLARKSCPLIVLRHGRALSRDEWDQDDRERPLTEAGRFQAEQVAPVLAAYGVTRIVSSSNRRCWATVAPYAEAADVEIEDTADLSQEDATPATVEKHVRALLEAGEPSVLCTHRPVLPWVFDALGLDEVRLAPGAVLVVHHRRGQVVATEQHEAPFQ